MAAMDAYTNKYLYRALFNPIIFKGFSVKIYMITVLRLIDAHDLGCISQVQIN